MKPINVKWDAVTKDAQGADLPAPPQYKVYVAQNTAAYGAAAVVTSGLEATITPPVVGLCKACVTASGPDADSAQSNTLTFTATLQTPAAPTNFAIVP